MCSWLNRALYSAFLIAFSCPVLSLDNYYYMTEGNSFQGLSNVWLSTDHTVAFGPVGDSYVDSSITESQKVEVCEAIANQKLNEAIAGINGNIVGQDSFVINMSGNQVSHCRWIFQTDAATGPTDVTINFFLDVAQCQPGQSPSITQSSFACDVPTASTCEEWGQTGESISGFMTTPLNEPDAYCFNLTNGTTIIDECAWDYHINNYAYDSNNSLIGRNITLTPTQQSCPDLDVMYISQLLPEQDQTPPGVPELTTGGKVANQQNDPTAPPPEYHTQPDASTVTDTTELEQLQLDMAQNQYDAQIETNKGLSDISQELDAQTDILSYLANQAGKEQSKRLATVSIGDNSCNSQPACSGDAIDCAILIETWAGRCEQKEQTTESQDLTDVQQQVDDYMNTTGNDFLEGELVDVNEILNSDPHYAMSSCPAPIQFSILSYSFQFSLEPVCTFADYLRPWLLMAAYLQAAFIIYRSF